MSGGASYGQAGRSLGGFVGHAGRIGQAHGLKAERATAELLDRLTTHGFTVFHSVSVRGGAADIDHVLVGSTGVVLIDTKSWKAGTYVRLGSRTYRRCGSELLPRRFAPGESSSLARSVTQMRQAGIPVAGAVVAVWPSGSGGRIGLKLMRYTGAKRIAHARRAVRAARRMAGSRGADPSVVAQVARWVQSNQERH